MSNKIIISEIETKDIRFPTSDSLIGSDAMNKDPDYSAAYIILKTNNPKLEGHGLTFTIGRGNELCIEAIKSLSYLIIGKDLESFTRDMASFWKMITGDSQLRWLGPEKGIIHLATGAIVNAVWDLYAKVEGKPLWKLLADMTPEKLASCIDFSYITDAITKKEAIEILKKNESTKHIRIQNLIKNGQPAYTTSAGWLGYSDEKIKELCKEAKTDGFKHIKMKELSKFNPWWIEEPTNPDDILGHAKIAKSIKPIKVATGEHCHNRVMFKQLIQSNAIGICQIDSCRVGGVNEVLAILLMAAKYDIPVCPHAGGVGLCEYVQHLSMIDYISISGKTENRVTEYVDHLHEHFEEPVIIKNAAYMPPKKPGYSITMKEGSIKDYSYPNGKIWLAKKI